MSETLTSDTGRRRSRRFRPLLSGPGRVAIVVALAIAAGGVTWALLRNTGSKSTPAPPARPAAARATSVPQLERLAASLHQPIFWIGPENGDTYELTRLANGTIYVRYLPAGVHVGASKPYLTVVTYPFPGAFAAIQKQASARGAVKASLARGGIALLDSSYPQSVHLAYPGVDYQVEVYDPAPARAMELVDAGRVSYFGNLASSPSPAATATTANPVAASSSELRSLAAAAGHPVYWAGPKPGYTYELTKTTSGSVFIRYLPRGAKVGASKAYLTVASYPFEGAFVAIQRLSAANKAGTLRLPGGGLGVVDSAYRKSVHLAFPGVDVEVEVFDPSPTVARRTVTSGAIRPVS